MRYFEGESKISRFCDAAVKLIFPPGTYCLVCGNFIDDTRPYLLCDHCIRNMRFGLIEIDLSGQKKETGISSELDTARSCMYYGLYEKHLVFGLKYNKKTYIARVIAEIMYDRILAEEQCAEELLNCDFIVPTSMTEAKERKRGFNQTTKFGKYLSGKTGVPLLEKALIKTRETDSQRAVSGVERYLNQMNLYSVKPEKAEPVRGKTVLLIDDVYTTGATANSMGKALKEAGVKKVHFLSLATGNVYAVNRAEENTVNRDKESE